jgi:hypothetical protein
MPTSSAGRPVGFLNAVAQLLDSSAAKSSSLLEPEPASAALFGVPRLLDHLGG